MADIVEDILASDETKSKLLQQLRTKSANSGTAKKGYDQCGTSKAAAPGNR